MLENCFFNLLPNFGINIYRSSSFLVQIFSKQTEHLNCDRSRNGIAQFLLYLGYANMCNLAKYNSSFFLHYPFCEYCQRWIVSASGRNNPRNTQSSSFFKLGEQCLTCTSRIFFDYKEQTLSGCANYPLVSFRHFTAKNIAFPALLKTDEIGSFTWLGFLKVCFSLGLNCSKMYCFNWKNNRTARSNVV